MKVFEDYLMYFLSTEKGLFYNRWLRPVSSDELRKGARLIHSLIMPAEVELWLVDASNCNTPAKDGQEWVITEIGKLLQAKGALLRKLALVKSGDIFFDVIAEYMQLRLGQVTDIPLVMQCFDTLPEAYGWLFLESLEAGAQLTLDKR